MYCVQYLADAAMSHKAALGFQFADRAVHPGRVWINLCKPVCLAAAERAAQHARTDGHELVRVHPVTRPAVRS